MAELLDERGRAPRSREIASSTATSTVWGRKRPRSLLATGQGGGDRSEVGQALPLVVLLLVAAAVLALAVGRVAERIVAGAEAQTAADAAALSGAVDGRAGAARFAGLNGGRLVSFAAAGPAVEVVVDVDGQTARARARRS